MKSKAAVLYEMGLPMPYTKSKPLKIEELNLDPPEPNEVLIKIKAVGLCHSDLSVINGSRPRPMPMALGHEAAGIIQKIGSNVQDFKEGDHVVCTFIPSCGRCIPCKEGRPALCETGSKSNEKGEMLEGGKRLYSKGKKINHHLGVSGFAEYAIVSTHSIVKVDPNIPFKTLALFGCAVITGVGAVINTAKIKAGATVAVVGLGGIGMNALMGANLAGAKEIIAIDINHNKFESAKKLGATSVYDSSDEENINNIKAATNGGLDYVFETAGVVQAMDFAYKITRKGGTTVTTGLPHPKHNFSLPQVTLAAEERTIKGSYVGSCIPSRDIPNFINLLKQNKLPIDSLFTKTISLDEINEGFDELANGKTDRLIVIP